MRRNSLRLALCAMAGLAGSITCAHADDYVTRFYRDGSGSYHMQTNHYESGLGPSGRVIVEDDNGSRAPNPCGNAFRVITGEDRGACKGAVK